MNYLIQVKERGKWKTLEKTPNRRDASFLFNETITKGTWNLARVVKNKKILARYKYKKAVF
jgi:hypothetical protein